MTNTSNALPIRLDPSKAVKETMSDSDWTFKVGVGGMLNAAALVTFSAGPLFWPATLACSSCTLGYSLRYLRICLTEKEAKLPDWSDWFDLFYSGLTWTAVQFMFFSLLVLFAASSFCVGMSIPMESPWFLPANIATLTIFFVLFLYFSLLSTFLMVIFAREENFKAAFAFGKVAKLLSINNQEKIIAWLLSLGMIWSAYLIPTMTIIGVFFIPSVVFLAQLVCAKLLAQISAKELQDISPKSTN
jgi:hypothetical protein